MAALVQGVFSLHCLATCKLYQASFGVVWKFAVTFLVCSKLPTKLLEKLPIVTGFRCTLLGNKKPAKPYDLRVLILRCASLVLLKPLYGTEKRT